jgi:hypothetical protein
LAWRAISPTLAIVAITDGAVWLYFGDQLVWLSRISHRR